MQLAEQGEVTVLSREDLYTKVWKTPMCRLAKEFGISDVGLAKICRKHAIPTPPRGYWARLEHGKKVDQPELPVVDDPSLQAIHIRRVIWPETVHGEQVSSREADAHPEQRIPVPEAPADLHPLVKRTQKSLRVAAPDEKGYVRPKAKQCLDVAVCRASLGRAMCVMDALVKALESQGHAVSVVDTESSRSTVATIMSEPVTIGLSSKQGRRDHSPTREEKRQLSEGYSWGIPKFDYFASEQLELRIVNNIRDAYRSTFGNGVRQRIEDCLDSVITSLMKAAEVAKVQRLEAEQRQREYQERKRQRRQLAERRETEEKYLKWLLAGVKGWITSQNIRSYLQSMRDAAMERYGEIHPESRLAQWMAWAEEQADRQDPLVQSLDSPMDHEHPYASPFSRDRFEFLRIENLIYLDPANAAAPPAEHPPESGHDRGEPADPTVH